MPPVLPAWDVSKPNLQGPSAQQGSAPTSRQLVALPGLALQQPAAPFLYLRLYEMHSFPTGHCG